MSLPRFKRPSLGTVLGLTALVVAVVGTANASSTRVVVRKGDIAKGAVTANALAKGAVHAKALAQGSVTAKAVGRGAIGASSLSPDAVTGPALAPASVYGGALGPTEVDRVALTDGDATADLSTWTPSTVAVAKCPPGQRLLAGGVVVTDSGNGRVGVLQSVPAEDGWAGQITSDSGGTVKAEVQVVCLK